MADNAYDSNANDLVTANKKVIETMVEYVEKTGDGEIPPAAIRYITDKLKTLTPLCKFHENIARGTVQVYVNFEGTVNKTTSMFRDGQEWRIRFTIDADIPPPESAQKKHMGFEIHLKKKSKVAGHVWCDAVPKGRPGTGARMNVSVSDKVDHEFPNTDTLSYSITTHTI